jgi:uncharacterized cupin superfamily protein
MIESTTAPAANLRGHLLNKGSSAGLTAADGNRDHLLNHSNPNAKQFVLGAIRMGEDLCHYSGEALGRIQR